MEQRVHNVRVAKKAGAHFSACVVWTATTSIAEVFFCMRWQSFVLQLCKMFSCRPDFPGYTPQPIAFNITINSSCAAYNRESMEMMTQKYLLQIILASVFW